jgi:Flp pilus assembly protein TadG
LLKHLRPADRAARARRSGERGAAAVEFALLSPILLILVFGIIDFGLAMNAQIIVANAVREGARTAALGGSYDATITAATRAETGVVGTVPTPTATCKLADGVTNCPTTGATAWTTGNTNSPPSGATVTVSITFSYHWITPIRMIPGLSSQLTFTRTSSMKVE